MASRLGLGFLLRYLSGGLSLSEALATLSARAGCRIAHVVVGKCAGRRRCRFERRLRSPKRC